MIPLRQFANLKLQNIAKKKRATLQKIARITSELMTENGQFANLLFSDYLQVIRVQNDLKGITKK